MKEYNEKTEKEWVNILGQEAYVVCRKKGTEPPFSGKYVDSKVPGTYHCVCCDEALFSSEDKYDSGTGWPSFTQPITSDAVVEKEDNSWFYTRTEIRSRYGNNHIGHVFSDGPKPTGLRYCMKQRSRTT